MPPATTTTPRRDLTSQGDHLIGSLGVRRPIRRRRFARKGRHLQHRRAPPDGHRRQPAEGLPRRPTSGTSQRTPDPRPPRTPRPISDGRPRRRTRPGTRSSRDGPNTDHTQIRQHRPQWPVNGIFADRAEGRPQAGSRPTDLTPNVGDHRNTGLRPATLPPPSGRRYLPPGFAGGTEGC